MTYLKTNKTKQSHLIKIAFVLCFSIASIFSINTDASELVAGKTILAKGNVQAIDQATKETRKLKRRSNIFDVDNITTGEKSKAQFSMSDGGLITLKANTEILISEYKFNDETGEGSATLEIVNGGLRSISGLIKKSGGDYQVKTPVGSIGIRGTHFSVDVVGENVFFGVYSGNIDVKLSNQQTLSLGASEDYSFASINSLGQITPMTQAPEGTSLGYSDSNIDDSAANESDEDSANDTSIVDDTTSPQVASQVTEETEDLEYGSVYNESELQGVSNSPIAELLSTRTGSLSYQTVIQSAVNSSVGPASDFNMNMVVDFDNASVPGGSLSFSDEQGEWFAAYSGLINIDKLDLGINFASHGNNKANGKIFAAFSNGLDEITGGFNLQETNNPSVNADGSFKLQP
jgi:hypothetical protein